jgi:hypothetical protein
VANTSVVRVGNGQGFWGDSVIGPTQLVTRGDIDYLTMDFLAEVTMSILHKQRARRPGAGYATDIVEVIERVLPACKERGIRVVANAGGVNPGACAEACEAVVRKLGLHGVRIGAVEGDDILGHLDALVAGGEELTNLDTGEALRARLDDVVSANVYLGAAPIAEALDEGADIVLTGRVVDAALTVGPLVHEFGWSATDYDALASATVAGHIIECGTQCTGGNFDRWEDAGDLTDIGYPVVEAAADGSFVVTKPPGTGGMVNADTVIAQLLYEIGDPTRYVTPDVVADFTSVRLGDDGPDRVRVDGVRGGAPTASYKVSLSLQSGWKAVGQLVVGGRDAVRKAEATARLLWERLAAEGTVFPPEQRLVEILGSGVVFPGMTFPGSPPPEALHEVVLRVGVRDADRHRVDRFGRELASLLTSGPPGLTGFAAGRPKASEVVAFWPALVGKDRVQPSVQVREVR